MLLICLLLASASAYAIWEVGDIITTDYSWTDSNGEFHSIFELVEAGKVVVFFWGGYG